MRYLLLIITFIILSPVAHGQELNFADSVNAYNKHRIKVNKTGLEVQGLWGIANIAAGSIGYFGAKEREGKYFSEMNGIFGILNTGLSATGLLMARKQMRQKLNYQQAYDKYRSDKEIFLIGAGLDFVYLGAGIGLYEYGNSAKSSADVYKGFGKSMVVQGVLLLLFDNLMLASHQKYNSRWYRLIDEIHFTGKGIGYSRTF